MKKQKVQAKINLETLAGGAFAEKLNEALMQVAENIQNPNTEATTKRQITVNIKFTPNKTRQMVGTQIAVTTKLAATEAIDTQMVMGRQYENRPDRDRRIRRADPRADGSLRLHGRRSGSGTGRNTGCSSYTGTESDRQASGSQKQGKTGACCRC